MLFSHITQPMAGTAVLNGRLLPTLSPRTLCECECLEMLLFVTAEGGGG